MTKLILDTNVYIGWLNYRLHEALVAGPGFVRYLSSVVQMELRAGAVTRQARRGVDHLVRAYVASGRVVAPSPAQFDEAGFVLQALRLAEREIRSASLVNDLLIALTARQIGATVYTSDFEDFEAKYLDISPAPRLAFHNATNNLKLSTAEGCVTSKPRLLC